MVFCDVLQSSHLQKFKTTPAQSAFLLLLHLLLVFRQSWLHLLEMVDLSTMTPIASKNDRSFDREEVGYFITARLMMRGVFFSWSSRSLSVRADIVKYFIRHSCVDCSLATSQPLRYGAFWVARITQSHYLSSFGWREWWFSAHFWKVLSDSILLTVRQKLSKSVSNRKYGNANTCVHCFHGKSWAISISRTIAVIIVLFWGWS